MGGDSRIYKSYTWCCTKGQSIGGKKRLGQLELYGVIVARGCKVVRQGYRREKRGCRSGRVHAYIMERQGM